MEATTAHMKPSKMALNKCIKGTLAERHWLCEQNFILFCLYYFSEYFAYPFADFHYDMAADLRELVDGKIKEVAWIEFRESAKTTFAKLAMIWMICYGKRRYINTDSFDSENSERLLFDVVYELSNNARLREDFGVLYRRSKSLEEVKQNRINNFVTENGIRVEAHTTQESMRGRLHLNQRPDCLIIDDFETNKTRDSQAYTKQVEKHLSEALGGMSTDGFVLYLGNYITEYGNVQALMDREKRDPMLRIRNVPVLDSKGVPTWPAKYALTDTEAQASGKVSIEAKIRQLGSQVFSYEMMNQPIDETLAEFKKEWIQRAEEKDIVHLSTYTAISIDPAMSKKDEADFTGIVINRITSENKWYIKAYQLKINSAELIEHLFYLVDTYSPDVLGVEETVFLLAVNPFLQDEMRRRNKFFSVTPLKHGGTKKETRIRGLIPRYESKSIFHVGDCADLERQMITFPRGLHDDCIAEGTLITTSAGDVPIETIQVDDLVLTRQGYKKVLKTWYKGELPVIYKLDMYATPDHRIITTRGDIALQYVNESDILHIWNISEQKIEKLSYTEVKNIIGTQNQKDTTYVSIFGDMINGMSRLNLYIGKYGLIKMEIFLKNITYITKTVIRSIIQSKIWNVLAQQSMHSIIRNQTAQEKEQARMQKEIMPRCKRLPRYGVILMLVKNGIASIRKLLAISQKKLFVSNAEKQRHDMHQVQSSVEINVEDDGVRANSDGSTPIITKKVYDLMVEDAHEFFANGILVHNCIDALAYQEQIAQMPYDKGEIPDEVEEKPLYPSINI